MLQSSGNPREQGTEIAGLQSMMKIFTVCGVIGVLQALETIKILLKLEDNLSGRMLLFDGYDTTFRCIKLRKKKLDCDVCGITPKVKSLIDYEQFCGSAANDKVRIQNL